MRKILCGILVFSTILLQSCGVMFGGSRYIGYIQVEDNPNAEIYVDGNKLGVGSAKGIFPRNRQLIVEVRQEGCEKRTQTFDKTFRAGNFILSFLCWGILGIGLDFGTGAAFKPAHNTNPNIKKLNTKNYNFTISYSECKIE
ncbi:hypothetical protein [Niabella digestorum]|uniref:PEGA domain-containing protein n=1 Tax=Niabella digestorum TaxID=3117701 RepID=A0ABU7RCI3_9BACT